MFKKSFPGDRELIAVVHTLDHGEVKMYVPTIRDYRDVLPTGTQSSTDKDDTNDTGYYKLVAKSINVPWEEFQEWAYTDMLTLVELLGDATNKLKPQVTRV